MNLITLKGLESIAKKEFEEQADTWVQAIAKRERIGFDELRPFLASLHYDPEYELCITFLIPEHAVIQLSSSYYAYHSNMVKLEEGELIGKYRWYTYSYNWGTKSMGFHHEARSLGHALLEARRAYEQMMNKHNEVS